ncbi:MAG: Cna B-type domain-containing protein, partial [Acutalibacteraceae bacterium]|nr:Cna B-type domain-containing protein [Acutalibacteraceae bacterium]
MNSKLLQKIASLNRSHSFRKKWQRVVSVLIAIVVFCTVYALILPAITMAKRPICGIEPHTHSEQCYQSTVSEAGLVQRTQICTLSEHIHTDACYPVEKEENQASKYLCGSDEHIHTEECTDTENNIACTIPEHTHNASCMVENLDINADVEQADDWQAQVDSLNLTGDWNNDVMLIARNQLGYTESKQNCILTDGSIKGYSRYGAWYGEAYADWNALFAGFCINYAGVEDYPFAQDVELWKTQLTEKGYYYNTQNNAQDYSPKTGDIVFIGSEVGFVNELIPATEEAPEKINVIIGDRDNTVVAVTYEISSSDITGYATLPQSNNRMLSCNGADYTVEVRFGKDAAIPQNATLEVKEILQDTEEYKSYYAQSVEQLKRASSVNAEENLEVTFARFFDISFISDGKVIEPDDSVDVQISYDNTIKVDQIESIVAVHFADDGIELLEVEAPQEEIQGNQVSTLEFTQNSFSVVGTVVSNYSANLNVTSATKVDFNSLSTGTQYVLYTQYNGKYYAITSKTGEKFGYSHPVTVDANGVVTWENADNGIFWSFARDNGNAYFVQNFASARYMHAFNSSSTDYGMATTGRYSSTLTRQYDGSFIAKGNGEYYTGIAVDTAGKVTFNRVYGSAQAARFYLARVGDFYNVWFDGTNGGMMSYYGADNLNLPAVKNNNAPVTITLPEAWQSSTKYDYTLQGWYNINTHTYYPVDPNDNKTVTAQINSDTVFYADWVASTYDVGQNNSNVVNSLDTNDFITTHVFDYNVLFNVQSLTHTGTISAGSHTENWSIVNNGTVPYNNNSNTLGFAFVDYDSDGDFSYPRGRDNTNVNQGDGITAGIINEVRQASGGKDIIDILFNPYTDVIGKKYVGTGNYLFQYMDSDTPNFDGQHEGYYYLDARRNAASYNQTDQRFYLYNYLERTSDSRKDGGIGQFSDFLPFNSPYIFDQSQLDDYVDRIMTPGYEYDAKDGASSYQEYNSADDANTNYFFGFSSEIEFYLPNDADTMDKYGNYGNISTHGDHMIFDFHGDDDVWVFIDGEMVLDIGGLHGVMFGQIDFSTGTVTYGKDGGNTVTKKFTEILGKNITEGTHHMTIYYMERGSSQSNCAIYFNVAPRYALELTKEDIATAEKRVGAEFTIYTCEGCANGNCTSHNTPQLAELWDSNQAHKDDLKDDIIDNAKSTFTTNTEGKIYCWGISAGKTYYIKETKPPDGYPETDDLIRITLNNRGTASIETTTLHGNNGVATEGFKVISQNVDNALQVVKLFMTNQKEGETTQIRVEKNWAEGSENLPNEITVYLTADGVQLGRSAKLNEGNGWSYTWTGLPKYADDGIDREIVYAVEEVLVPDYITTQDEIQRVENYVDWVQVDQMSDSKTYLLVHNGQALTYNQSGFGWMSPETAKLDTSTAAHWRVTTELDGFHLKNTLGYTLTFDRKTNKFYGVNDDSADLNQVVYYLNSRLVIHDQDVYYQFGSDGSA